MYVLFALRVTPKRPSRLRQKHCFCARALTDDFAKYPYKALQLLLRCEDVSALRPR
ncbi:hypothetical protein CGSMWGv00703Bmash_04475 [Gardnerella pickettii 00703Bmash]|nr:hypothetical protein CGSMWGv00703Bmash_04475 [Gardnerella pickettii 00703Bmash]